MIPLYLQFGKYKPDWGDVPTWLAAFFALAAGFIAWRAFVVSHRALKVSTEAHETSSKLLEVELERDQEARQDRRDRDDAERRAPADKVAAWFAQNGPRHVPGQGPSGLGAFIRNASDLPVYEVRIGYHEVLPPELPGSFTPIVGMSFLLGGVLPPDDRVFVDFPEADVVLAADADVDSYVLTLAFRDAAGVRWERGPDGKLKKQ